mmetsp:Transcript_7768/g.20004  ORF Transcript_7768/g.20004 Transcript_7768/m.20004 type:complete len:211 (+) Transcript_7768:1221-1853(+)
MPPALVSSGPPIPPPGLVAGDGVAPPGARDETGVPPALPARIAAASSSIASQRAAASLPGSPPPPARTCTLACAWEYPAPPPKSWCTSATIDTGAPALSTPFPAPLAAPGRWGGGSGQCAWMASSSTTSAGSDIVPLSAPEGVKAKVLPKRICCATGYFPSTSATHSALRPRRTTAHDFESRAMSVRIGQVSSNDAQDAFVATRCRIWSR